MPSPRFKYIPFSRIIIAFLAALLAGSAALAKAPDERELAKRFFSQPAATDVRLTPGNLGLSYIGSHRSRSELQLIDLPSGSNYRAVIETFPNVYDYYWIDRDSVLIYAERLGQPIGAYVTNYRLSSPDPTLFTRMLDTLPDRKNLFIAREGKNGNTFPSLYLVNAYTESKTTLEKNPGHIVAYYTDKDGVPRVRHFIDEQEKDQFEYRLNESEPWRPIAIDGHPVGVAFLGEGNDFLTFVRRRGEDRFAAYRFDPDSNQYLDTVLDDEEYDILFDRMVLDPETEETFGFHYETDRPRSFWFDPKFAQLQQEIDRERPDAANLILGYGPNRESLIYRSYSDRQPDRWIRRNLATSEESVVLSSYPDIDPSQTARIEPLRFPNRDGVSIHALLTRSIDHPHRPGKTVIMIHGGPRSRDRWGWDPEAQFFAALGYHVFKINYRGSEGFGADYSPYSHFQSMQTSVADAIDGARWLARNGVADPSKIAIYGSSFGGHVALRAAADAPDLFAAAVGYAGVYDWPAQLDAEFAEEPIYSKLKFATYYGDFDTHRQPWLEASAIAKADQIRASVLLIHGRADDAVSPTQSRKMRQALKKADVPVQLKLLAFNRHGLTQESNRVAFYTAIARFLETEIAVPPR